MVAEMLCSHPITRQVQGKGNWKNEVIHHFYTRKLTNAPLMPPYVCWVGLYTCGPTGSQLRKMLARSFTQHRRAADECKTW